MSDMLYIGASGVRAFQSALTTTSENIANAGTAGYVRRSASLGEVNAAGAGLTNAKTLAGQGAFVKGVTRAGDMFRSAEIRVANSEVGRSEAGVQWLERVEQALTGFKLDERITGFFNAAQSVAADPAASAPRAVMLEDAANLAAAFRGTSEQLQAAIGDLDGIAQRTAGEINNLSSALATANGALSRAAEGSSTKAFLMDERDRLLDSLSQLVDTNPSFDEFGRVSVKIGGGDGVTLVSGDNAGMVTYSRNAQGTVAYNVVRSGTRSAIQPTGGALAGIADGAQRIADALTSVDMLADDFVTGVNAVQSAGRDLSGNPGVAIFSGDSAASISITLADPRGIAASGLGGGPRDNSNLANFAALRRDAGFEDGITGLIAGNGAALSGKRLIVDAQSAIRTSAREALEAASGVNLDEEAVALMRFQQAYQASSRVIQVARETIQSILDIR